MALSYREVAEILKIIDASACNELILELEGTKLVVRRGETGNGQQGSGYRQVRDVAHVHGLEGRDQGAP